MSDLICSCGCGKHIANMWSKQKWSRGLPYLPGHEAVGEAKYRAPRLAKQFASGGLNFLRCPACQSAALLAKSGVGRCQCGATLTPDEGRNSVLPERVVESLGSPDPDTKYNKCKAFEVPPGLVAAPPRAARSIADIVREKTDNLREALFRPYGGDPFVKLNDMTRRAWNEMYGKGDVPPPTPTRGPARELAHLLKPGMRARIVRSSDDDMVSADVNGKVAGVSDRRCAYAPDGAVILDCGNGDVLWLYDSIIEILPDEPPKLTVKVAKESGIPWPDAPGLALRIKREDFVHPQGEK